MKDISNRTVATIMVVSVVIFLSGIWINISQTNDLTLLTGNAVSTGEANLTVSSVTEITNQVTSIDWGSGYVNSSYTNCTLNTEGVVHNGCVTFTNQTSGFLLENTGNTNLSVNYSSSKIASTFIGGTGPVFQLRVSPNNASSQSGENSAADTLNSCNQNWTPSAYTNITAAGTYLCGNQTVFAFEFGSANDAAVVDIQIQIPEDAPVEAKTATLTFNGVST